MNTVDFRSVYIHQSIAADRVTKSIAFYQKQEASYTFARKKMRIAIWKKGKSEAQAEMMLDALRQQAGDGAFEVAYMDGNQPEEQLYTNQADAVLLPLADLPPQAPDATVFSAVLPRMLAHTGLSVGKDVLDFSAEFRMKQGTEVISNHFILAEQLRNYRPELRYHVQEIGAFAMGQQAKTINLLYCDTPLPPDWVAGEHEQRQIFTIDPREITPIAGAGVLAFLCLSDDVTTRTGIKQWHHSPTAQCSNIERAFERAFAVGGNRKKTAAHCQRDTLGNYHAQFCIYTEEGILERVSLSRSTSAGMADEAIAWAMRFGG